MENHAAPPAQRRLIRLPEVIATVGVCRAEIYRLAAAGKFPRPVPLGPMTSAWDSNEVQAWISARIAEREALSQQRSEAARRLVHARTEREPRGSGGRAKVRAARAAA